MASVARWKSRKARSISRSPAITGGPMRSVVTADFLSVAKQLSRQELCAGAASTRGLRERRTRFPPDRPSPCVIRSPILHVHPDDGRASRHQTPDRLGHPRPADFPWLAATAAGLHVEVDAVLRDLGLRDLQE